MQGAQSGQAGKWRETMASHFIRRAREFGNFLDFKKVVVKAK